MRHTSRTARIIMAYYAAWMVALAVVVVAPGCMTAEEYGAGIAAADAKVTEATTAGEVLKAEIAGLRADLEALGKRDPVTGELVAGPAGADAALDLAGIIDSKTAEATKWLDRLSAAELAARKAREEAAEASNAWDWAEVLAGLAAGVFPPAAIAVPMVTRSRRAFDGVVAAVAAGGGPKDSAATRQAMAAVPGLKERVTRARVRMGDKRMEAVPSRNNEPA